MKLTFVSNYINHHQIPTSNALYEALGAEYHFIQTEPMAEERVSMGWGTNLTKLPYLKCYYEAKEECASLIMNSDIVVFGGVEDESYIEPRLTAKKPVIRYSERLYREGQWKAISPKGLLKKYHDHTRYRNAPVYLLCAGAYVASDFHIVHAYPDKMLKWGYFPPLKEYDLTSLLENKKGKSVEILWAGRFLPLKHPEYAIHLAEHLKQKDIAFHLTMVGGGALEEALKKEVKEKDLSDLIAFTGFKRPEEVRGFMERANIFLFTSNHLEGWGAVLNEAMNGACAVVAGAGIGAVPFLIEHGKNGLIYKDEKEEEFLSLAEEVVKNNELAITLGKNAFQTITTTWNASHAVKSLLTFADGILAGRMDLEDNGPCSKALVISPRKGYSYVRR